MQYSRLHYSLLIYLLNGFDENVWIFQTDAAVPLGLQKMLRVHSIASSSRLCCSEHQGGAGHTQQRATHRCDDAIHYVDHRACCCPPARDDFCGNIYITNISTIFVFILSPLRVNMQ